MNMFFRIMLDYDALTDQIVARIPEEAFISSGTTFIDPAFAGGQFLRSVARRLRKYGHSIANIRSRLFGFEDNICYLNHPKNKSTKLIAQLSVMSYEEFLNMTMQFDVAVGNPPFQGNNEVDCNRTQPKNHNLWTKFIHKCFSDLVKDDGYVAFVTPDSWMSPSNKIFQLFKKYQLLQVDLECSKYFNVGSSFTAWIAQKSPITKETVLGTVSVNLKDFPYLPRHVEQTLGIHKKVISSSNARMPVVGDTTCHSSKEVVALQQCDHFCYPLLHTNAQERYSKIKSKYFDHIKVMWTLSGNYIPHIDLGVKGFTEVNQAIIAKDETQANNILSIMNSDLYRFIVTTAKWSGFLNGKVFTMLPKLDFDKSWSNDEIYTAFGLTLEEIAIVEANI